MVTWDVVNLKEIDFINQLVTLSVITLSSFHCVSKNKNRKLITLQGKILNFEESIPVIVDINNGETLFPKHW